MAACSLHGPFIGVVDYNGLRYLIGPWLCPALVATYYCLRPFRPYKSGAARYAGLVDYDSEDVDARRLSTIFASNEARRFLLRATAKLSSQLFALMVLVMILHWRSLNWNLASPWLVQGLSGAWIGSFLVLITQLVRWGIDRWTSAEA
jgi:hypothetical protein